VNAPSRAFAALAYLPLVWLYGLMARREDPLVAFHARQGLALSLLALGAPLAWAILAWLLTWVPGMGPILAVVLFGLVIAAELLVLAGLLIGVVGALRGRADPVPLVGSWAERFAN
jgi:uncharacterized membrane protein